MRQCTAMTKLLLKRFALILSVLISWTWATVTFVFDWIGRSTVGDDYNQALLRLPGLVKWITTLPWYVPITLAVALSAALVVSTTIQTMTVMGPLERQMRDEVDRQEKRRAELVSASGTVDRLRARKGELLALLREDEAEIVGLTARWTTGEISIDEMHDQLGALAEKRKARPKLFEDTALEDAALFVEDGVNELAKHAKSSVVSETIPSFASLRHSVLYGNIERDIEQVGKFIDTAVIAIDSERAALLAEMYRKKRRRVVKDFLAGQGSLT